MRLVVDNWILTTIRQNDEQAKQRCLTIDQRVDQEQNLFDTTSHDDSDASIVVNRAEVNEEKMTSQIDMIKDLTSLLYNALDLDTFAVAEERIDQVRSILVSLDDEYAALTHKITEQFYEHQDEIAKYVQGTLVVKNLCMSQCVHVLDQAYKSLFELVESSLLDQICLDKAKIMLRQIQTSSLMCVDRIKTTIKLKINRLHAFLNIWNEFEQICRHLDTTFDKHTHPFVCSIQYRSVLIEINNQINRLKEKLNKLTCALSEAKYFEFKNLIVINEIKFKKLKETNEKERNVSPEALVPSSSKQIVRVNHPNVQTPVSFRSASMFNKSESIKQTDRITCDKSTFTVSHESTQTESMYESEMQSDGKKMLLEAYLRNNDNLASCSTSSKKNKSESGTGLMRESGIGTANDDDSLPLTDVEKISYEEEDKLNISVETYPIDNHKRYMRKKANKLKSLSTLSSSSTSSTKTEPNVLYQRKQTNNKKQNVKQIPADYLNQSNSNQCSILRFVIEKIIKFIFIFLLPILFILLFVAYVLYRNYLNPNCCDMKRNYLLINIT